MMEYTSKYWNMLTPLIKKSLLKRYGKEETAELLRKTNQIYRDMLRRADDIGKDNPMASNLYEGLIFLALWDASDRQISVDELRTISEEMMSFPFLKAMGLQRPHGNPEPDCALPAFGQGCGAYKGIFFRRRQNPVKFLFSRRIPFFCKKIM